MEEKKKIKGGFTPFYYLLKLFVNLAGFIFGSLLACLLFYPLLFSFPNNVVVVFIELYIIILLAIGFKALFNQLFTNYVNYRPLFFKISLKLFFSVKKLILSFYILGLIFVFFFIWGLF